MTLRTAYHALGLAACLLAACAGDRSTPVERDDLRPDAAPAPAPAPDAAAPPVLPLQVDPALGRKLLLDNGTEAAPYLSCGVPRSIVDTAKLLGLDPFAGSMKLPERERGNADLPYDMSYAKTRSGVEVLSTNCLLCHASKLGGSLIIGLGNPNVDFATEGTLLGIPTAMPDLLMATLNDAERAEFARFSRVTAAEGGVRRPDTRGLNPADVMFGVLAAHRDAQTLRWSVVQDPDAQLDVDLVFTDVPPWWNLHRRDRMFYSGFGRGNHARIMMSAALLCLEDTDEAAAIDVYFPHIEAFIRSLRAPRYEDVAKRPIDMVRAARGRELFVATCARCHGDAELGIDPLPSIAAAEVGTDPAYAVESSLRGTGAVAYYFDFFNRSWYGTHGAAGRLEREPEPVYSPPPLDGVWATAPYFHNGSVPTLDAVLDPALRPQVFRRSFDPDEYDFERLGWPYLEVAAKGDDVTVYDTTRATYHNSGHTFAAALGAEARRDLLEYLKTL